MATIVKEMTNNFEDEFLSGPMTPLTARRRSGHGRLPSLELSPMLGEGWDADDGTPLVSDNTGPTRTEPSSSMGPLTQHLLDREIW